MYDFLKTSMANCFRSLSRCEKSKQQRMGLLDLDPAGCHLEPQGACSSNIKQNCGHICEIYVIILMNLYLREIITKESSVSYSTEPIAKDTLTNGRYFLPFER